MPPSTTKLTESAKVVLEEADEDFVDLWQLLWMVGAEENVEDDPAATREAGQRVMAELVKGGYIRAGFPNGRDHFDPWPFSADEAVERIEREWKALGREPNISEVVWFDITEKGRAYLSQSEGGTG